MATARTYTTASHRTACAFSGHADTDDLINWADTSRTSPHTTFVVHGEADSSAALRSRLQSASWTTVMPRYGERVVI